MSDSLKYNRVFAWMYFSPPMLRSKVWNEISIAVKWLLKDRELVAYYQNGVVAAFSRQKNYQSPGRGVGDFLSVQNQIEMTTRGLSVLCGLKWKCELFRSIVFCCVSDPYRGCHILPKVCISFKYSLNCSLLGGRKTAVSCVESSDVNRF